MYGIYWSNGYRSLPIHHLSWLLTFWSSKILYSNWFVCFTIVNQEWIEVLSTNAGRSHPIAPLASYEFKGMSSDIQSNNQPLCHVN